MQLKDNSQIIGFYLDKEVLRGFSYETLLRELVKFTCLKREGLSTAVGQDNDVVR